MIPIDYTSLQFAKVDDKVSFFRENIKEVRKLSSIYQAAKLLVGVPSNRINIEVAEGQRVYKVILLDPEPNRNNVIGSLIYIPSTRRLDIYDYSISNQIPLLQVVGRKIVYKNYSILMDRVGLGSLFKPIINLL